jgi:hypothetical protein
MTVLAANGLRDTARLLTPNRTLAAAAAFELALEVARTETGSSLWLVTSTAVSLAALLQVWRHQDELRLGPVLLVALGFHLGLVWAHDALGAMGDGYVRSVHSVQGSELVHGHYPASHYPVGAVLLFGLESLLGGGAAETANRLLMLPFQLVCVLGVWGLRTRTSSWFAAVIAIWPLNTFFWEYRIELVTAALLLIGLLLVDRGRWGWSGVALAIGAAVRWSPALSFGLLAVWLLSCRRWRDARRLGSAFVATAVLVAMPVFLWSPHAFLAPFRRPSWAITNRSVWFAPLDALGLTNGHAGAIGAKAGAPYAATLAVAAVQVLLLGVLLGIAWSVRDRPRAALALAAIAPAAVLLTGGFVDPQFVLVLTAALAFSGALVSRTRPEQLRLGLLLMAASFANAFVYPNELPGDVVSWRPFSVALFAAALVATGLIVGRAATMAEHESAPGPWSLGGDLSWRAALAALRHRPPSTAPAPWVGEVARQSIVPLGTLFLVPTVFAAIVLPYRFWDSMAYGVYSRVIAATGSFQGDAIDLNLHRPLFYVAQGLAWRAVGYHEWVGRLLSVAFGAGFVLCACVLAGRLGRTAEQRRLLRGFALAGVLGSSVFATYVAAGMADVPVATAAAATALAMWSPGLGRTQLPLVALAAAATALAKPTGLLALAGLVLAAFVIPGGRRAIAGVAGIVAGSAVALIYDEFQARYLGESLEAFLRAGNADYWVARANAVRWDAGARADWFGAGLRLVVLFAVVYALARAVGARSRAALRIAGPAALLLSIVGPIAADGRAPYPFGEPGLALVGYLLVAGSLLAAPLVPSADPLDRRAYAAGLLWIAPGALAWIVYRPDAVRYLSPTWPGLILLIAACLTAVTYSLARLSPAAPLAPLAGAALLALANVTSIDGLGRAGWRGLLELGPSGWTDKGQVENFAYANFSYELDLARENLGPGDRIVSNDARLSYFFPGRVTVLYPVTCSDLAGARYVALLLGGESADFARLASSSTDPLAWLQCRRPRVRLVGEHERIFASFVVGRSPARPSTPVDCLITSTPGELDDAVFAEDVDYAAARSIARRAAKAGFQHIRIEHTNCSVFRVVITGLSTTAGGQADFRREAESTGFHVKFMPALRYPEVPPDVPAVR